MKILFTGGSSFSGLWFVKELIKNGHQVTVCCRSSRERYQGIRLLRIKILEELCETVYCCPFGSPEFLQRIEKESSWDFLCHHGAEVGDYKSPDFNPISSLTNNTYQLKEVIKSLKGRSCNRIVLTGTVFEQNEGDGTDGLRAVSPYGLSKGMTSQFFQFYCEVAGIKLGKFVIPNPFGPYEERRYTTILAESWFQGKKAFLSYPEYVRDNIPISLLAKTYCSFVETLKEQPGFEKINPGWYRESQKAFTERFASEMRSRLKMPCEYEVKEQNDFAEPLIRINYDILDKEKLNWNEERSWDDLAIYYEQMFGSNR